MNERACQWTMEWAKALPGYREQKINQWTHERVSERTKNRRSMNQKIKWRNEQINKTRTLVMNILWWFVEEQHWKTQGEYTDNTVELNSVIEIKLQNVSGSSETAKGKFSRQKSTKCLRLLTNLIESLCVCFRVSSNLCASVYKSHRVSLRLLTSLIASLT